MWALVQLASTQLVTPFLRLATPTRDTPYLVTLEVVPGILRVHNQKQTQATNIDSLEGELFNS